MIIIQNTIGVFENIGGLELAEKDLVELPFSSANRTLEVIDFDGNGDNDLVIYDKDSLFYFQNDDSNYSGPFKINDISMAFSEFKLGKVDADELIDIVFIDEEGSQLQYMRNEGNGFFSDPILIYNGNLTISKFELKDVDNDNDLDLLAFDNEIPEFGWFENNGDGVFSDFEFKINYNNLNNITTVLDLDNNGLNEIYFSQSISTVGIELSELGEVKDLFTIENMLTPLYLFQVDFDSDEDLDLVCMDEDHMYIYENLGDSGYFAFMKYVFFESTGTGGFFSDLDFIDYDKDGDLDILLSKFQDGIQIIENTDGKGNYDSPTKLDIATNTDYLRIADVNGDENEDLLIFGDSDVGFLLDESGSFDNYTPLVESIPSAVVGMDVVDFDKDGDLDILIVMEGGLGWINNLGGSYSPLNMLNTSQTSIWGYKLGDIDNNGFIDILVLGGTSSSSYVQYHSLDELYNWEETFLFEVNFATRELVLDYVDSDNNLDIIINNADGEFYVYLQDDASFKNVISVPHSFNSPIYFLNIDDSPQKEFVLVDKMKNEVYWMENIFSYAVIRGNVFLDENINGIFEANEIPLNDQKLTLNPGSINSWSYDNGDYYFIADSAAYTLQCIPSEYFELTTSGTVDTVLTNHLVNLNFGVKAIGEVDEVSVELTSAANRCGFTVPFWVQINNTGTSTRDAHFELKIDSLTSFISSSVVPDSIADNSIYFSFGDILPTYSRSINLELQMPSVDFIGDTVFYRSATTLVDDNQDVVAVDTTTLAAVINCAYDPNDKLVKPVYPKYPDMVLLDDKLTYTIRFQNTGTDTAFNVLLVDELDLNLDLSSFRFLASSHLVNYSLEERTLYFSFENILLPDSNVNFSLSQGFVSFEIGPKADIQSYTSVFNSAEIYFDFNPAIISNEVLTIFVDQFPVSTAEYLKDRQILSLKPNPTRGNMFVRFEDVTSGTLNILSSTGELILKKQIKNEQKIELDLSNQIAGMYLVQFINDMGNTVYEKLVLQ